MLSDLASIALSGASFPDGTVLDLFKRTEEDAELFPKACLVYGRSGAGKTRLAKALRELAAGSKDAGARLLDSRGAPVALDADERRRLMVFDERYVEENVQLRYEGLRAIVVFGRSAELDGRLRAEREALVPLRYRLEELEREEGEFSDAKNPKSPAYQLAAVKARLRAAGGWAERDRRLRGAASKRAVRDETHLAFAQLKPARPRDEIRKDFETRLEALERARLSSGEIGTPVPKLDGLPKVLGVAELRALLSLALERPELSGREERLLALVESGRASELAARARALASESLRECPWCLQPISPQQRESLAQSVSRVLGREAEEHRRALEAALLPELRLDLSPFSDLSGRPDCERALDAAARALRANNALLRQKLEAPYQPLDQEPEDLEARLSSLEKALEALEAERKRRNWAARNQAALAASLAPLNAELAYYDIFEPLAAWERQVSLAARCREELAALSRRVEERERAIARLEVQKRNLSAAAGAINACLDYVFAAGGRLRVECEGESYVLFSRGLPVFPGDLSAGERKILALAHFLSSVFEGRDPRTAYEAEHLVVLDDPLSGLDEESRAGVLALLERKLGQLLRGNMRSRALVLTHELSAMEELSRILRKAAAALSAREGAPRLGVLALELVESRLLPFQAPGDARRAELLKGLLCLARGEEGPFAAQAGNLSRLVLRDFARARYGREPEELAGEASGLLPSPEAEKELSALLDRLAVRDGDRARGPDFFQLLSVRERSRTARLLLGLLHRLDPARLSELLGKEAAEEIASWSGEEEGASPLF